MSTSPPGPYGPPPQPAVKPKRKRRWVAATIVGVVSFFLGVGIGASGGEEQVATAAGEPTATVTAEAQPAPTVTVTAEGEPAPAETVEVEVPGPTVTVTADAEPEPAAETEPAAEPEPEPAQENEKAGGTTAQQNAVGSAESYLAYSDFSRSGLIEQLEFEDYSTEDATWAVDRVSVDWNEQAARAAESYLGYSDFSRSGLIEQLEFEGYTPEQAEYGASQNGF